LTESGINVGVTEFCIITIGGYVDYFSHIFQGLRLFRTLE
jgi:hypothetical protein